MVLCVAGLRKKMVSVMRVSYPAFGGKDQFFGNTSYDHGHTTFDNVNIS
jgi:hypothetical protein